MLQFKNILGSHLQKKIRTFRLGLELDVLIKKECTEILSEVTLKEPNGNQEKE